MTQKLWLTLFIAVSLSNAHALISSAWDLSWTALWWAFTLIGSLHGADLSRRGEFRLPRRKTTPTPRAASGVTVTDTTPRPCPCRYDDPGFCDLLLTGRPLCAHCGSHHATAMCPPKGTP